MNEQTATDDKQNRRLDFSRKGNHKSDKQNNHAQTIAAFNNSGHVPLIVKQIYCRLFWIGRNVGIAIKKKHRVFGLLRHQLRKPVNLKFSGIKLTQIAFVNKSQKQVSQQKLPEKLQKRFVTN